MLKMLLSFWIFIGIVCLCIYYVSSAEYQTVVACVGDSITFGSGPNLGNRLNNSYPAKLQWLFTNDILRDGYVVSNWGVIGATATNGSRLTYMKTKIHSSALKSRPHIVLMMLGTNDALLKLNVLYFKSSYQQMINIYQNTSNSPLVYVITPPWQALTTSNKENINTERFKNVNFDPYIAALKELAGKNALPFIDLYSIFVGREDLLIDGLHPNLRGYEMIAKLIYRAMIMYDANKQQQQSQDGNNNEAVDSSKQRASYKKKTIKTKATEKMIKDSNSKSIVGSNNIAIDQSLNRKTPLKTDLYANLNNNLAAANNNKQAATAGSGSGSAIGGNTVGSSLTLPSSSSATATATAAITGKGAVASDAANWQPTLPPLPSAGLASVGLVNSKKQQMMKDGSLSSQQQQQQLMAGVPVTSPSPAPQGAAVMLDSTIRAKLPSSSSTSAATKGSSSKTQQGSKAANTAVTSSGTATAIATATNTASAMPVPIKGSPQQIQLVNQLMQQQINQQAQQLQGIAVAVKQQTVTSSFATQPAEVVAGAAEMDAAVVPKQAARKPPPASAVGGKKVPSTPSLAASGNNKQQQQLQEKKMNKLKNGPTGAGLSSSKKNLRKQQQSRSVAGGGGDEGGM